jgi:hypothetical protein
MVRYHPIPIRGVNTTLVKPRANTLKERRWAEQSRTAEG